MSKAKKTILLALSCAAIAGGAASCSFSVEKDGISITKPMIIMRADDGEIGQSESESGVSDDSSEWENNPGESGEAATPGMMKDEDGNGIPDAIEDYYAEHIQEKYMFGISLGSLIGLATSVLGWLFIALKNKGFFSKASAWMGEQKENADKIIEKYSGILDQADEANEKLRAFIGEYSEEVKAVIDEQRSFIEQVKAKEAELEEGLAAKAKEIEERGKQLIERLENDEAKLKELAKSSAKIDAILDNTVLLSKTEEYVKKGLARLAEENKEEARR